jgi:DNA/RNA endonuclease YhcR with UshA esterase domain
VVFAVKLSADETNNLVPLKIGASEASKYYDQEMIVTGKVAQVTIRPKVVFLNIDTPFPNSPFTLVIFYGETNKFGDLKALDGKNIEAKGKIKKYRDKPEIILSNANQLKVIMSDESTNSAYLK